MTVEAYIAAIPEKRREAFLKLRRAVMDNLPPGFAETIQYGMIGYVVPLEAYPQGYLGNASQPLPFMALASQKQSINLYHMGLYADTGLMAWFRGEWAKVARQKLDMGKSCIRFSYPEEIPYDAIAELAGKISVAEWIKIYEDSRSR